MAVIYSKLGGCLGDTTKLGPLARTDLCAWVKGLLDKLMNHLGLGSSEEDPWWSLLEGKGWVPSQGLVVPAWEVALFPQETWGALHLAECPNACLSWGVTVVNNPTLNNNIGKFNLPHIWDRVFLNTKGLNLKRQINNNNTQPNEIN